MKKTEIFFPFEPVPKGRPRFTRTGHAYTPKTTKEYEKKISDYYKSQTTDYYESAIQVHLVFNMQIPKSLSKSTRKLMATGEIKCTTKKDIDNLAKAVLDGILGIAYEDDRLITKLTVIKRYAVDDNVGTEMVISEDVE